MESILSLVGYLLNGGFKGGGVHFVKNINSNRELLLKLKKDPKLFKSISKNK